MKIKAPLSLFLALAVIFGSVLPVSAQSIYAESDSNVTLSCSHPTIFDPGELTDAELRELCNKVNNVDRSNKDPSFCYTEAVMDIEYYYSKFTKQRQSVPDYLSTAYSKTHSDTRASTYATTTNEYVISAEGRFRVFYNQASPHSDIVDLANTIASIFDYAHLYLCNAYDFPAPPTNSEGYYDIHIIADDMIDHMAYTSYDDDGLSYISISQGPIEFYYDNDAETYVWGLAIHEYTHAVLNGQGIFYNSTDLQCFNESLATAIAIEWDEQYANESGKCTMISNFVSSLSISMASLETNAFKYGGALFYLFIYEDYDEWDTISEMINNYDLSSSVFDNLNASLIAQGEGPLSTAYIHFLACAVDPDVMFSTAPANRLDPTEYYVNSWGTPDYRSIINIHSGLDDNYISHGSLSYLAAQFIKIETFTYVSKRVTMTITYNPFGMSVPQAAIMVHNRSTGNYTYYGNGVVDNEYQLSLTMNITANDIVYLVIANAGNAGNLTYSYSIDIN